MKLYYTPKSCSIASWIALEWVGADYEVEKAETKSEEYRKINPAGTVPALDIGDGKILTENTAILKYIADTHREKNLGADEGLIEEFKYNKLSSFLNGFHSAFGPYYVPERFTVATDETSIENVLKAAYISIDNAMKSLDNLLEGKDYLYNNKKTVLDAYAYVMVRWTDEFEKSWKDYPNVKRFVENLEKDEAVKTAYRV